jgi:signal transduction histidine kinase
MVNQTERNSSNSGQSITFKIYLLIALSVLFVLIEFGGNFYFNKLASDRIAKSYNAHRLLDQAETCMKIANTLSQTYQNLFSNPEKQDSWDVFKRRTKEMDELLHGAESGSTGEIRGRIQKAIVNLKSVEYLGEKIFSEAFNTNSEAKAEDVEANTLLIERSKLQLVEQLDKLRVDINSLDEKTFGDAYSQRYFPMITGLALALILSLFAGWIGMGLGRHLVRSVRNLMSATNAFAKGDLTYRAKILSNDELGTLTLSFNDMAAHLQSAKGEVENALQELKHKQLQLVQSGKLAALGEMSSGIAHELNNPLLLIKGFNNRTKAALEKMGGAAVSDNVRDYIKEVDENCDRMKKIIQHLRDFSRQAEQHFSVISVNEIVDKSFMLLNEQLRLRNIEIKKRLTEGNPKINGEANRLEQVFINLISNSRDALESMPEDQVKSIEVSSKIEVGSVIVRISDNGMGVDASNIEKIFNPFFTTKEVGKGTGLGLSISHSIIKEHKGDIWCESTPGHGASFCIRLPLADQSLLAVNI